MKRLKPCKQLANQISGRRRLFARAAGTGNAIPPARNATRRREAVRFHLPEYIRRRKRTRWFSLVLVVDSVDLKRLRHASRHADATRRGCDSPSVYVSPDAFRRGQRGHTASGNGYDNELGCEGLAPRLAIVSLSIDIRGPSNCSLSAPSENTATAYTTVRIVSHVESSENRVRWALAAWQIGPVVAFVSKGNRRDVEASGSSRETNFGAKAWVTRRIV